MLFGKKPDKEKNFKNLSEKEIQKQLYGEYLKDEERVEVMDSSFIANEREEYQIKEKIDDKARKELTAELDGLKAEFKRLQGEVGRLKKEKESLDKSDIWFRPPLLKTRHLVIIGSVVVLIAAATIIVLTFKFFVSKVGHKEGSKPSVQKVLEPAKKSVKSVKKASQKKR
jgi:hypothetical protein